MVACFITGRNEVVEKVIFLHLFVILFTGGWGCLPQCMLGYHTPRSRHTSPEQTPPRADPPGADTPLGADTHLGVDTLGADTPQSRHPRSRHPSPLEQTPLPPGADTLPPGADTLPPSRHPPVKQTRAYGQWVAGTHPTGMHSCCGCFQIVMICSGSYLILKY